MNLNEKQDETAIAETFLNAAWQAKNKTDILQQKLT